MAIGELYRVIDRQTLQNQLVLNVYWFEQSAGTGGADDCAEAYIQDIGALVRAFQSNQLTHNRVDVTNMDDPTDYVEKAWTANNAGSLTGEVLPPYVVFAFRLNRVSRDVRHGQKRYSGIVEGSIENGVPVSGTLTLLNNLATALAQPISWSSGDGTYDPKIVKRTGTSPNFTYTPYAVGSAQFVRFSSQNTRKVGRGS